MTGTSGQYTKKNTSARASQSEAHIDLGGSVMSSTHSLYMSVLFTIVHFDHKNTQIEEQ